MLIFTSVSWYFVFQYCYYPIVVFPGANMYFCHLFLFLDNYCLVFYRLMPEFLYLDIYQVAIFRCYVCFFLLFGVVGDACGIYTGAIYTSVLFGIYWGDQLFILLEMSQNLNLCPFELLNGEKSIMLFTFIEL